MIAMMVMMEKSLLKIFIFGLRLVLDYNEACTNEEDCQDWIVKIKVNNFVFLSKYLYSESESESESENRVKECCFPLKVFV